MKWGRGNICIEGGKPGPGDVCVCVCKEEEPFATFGAHEHTLRRHACVFDETLQVQKYNYNFVYDDEERRYTHASTHCNKE